MFLSVFWSIPIRVLPISSVFCPILTRSEKMVRVFPIASAFWACFSFLPGPSNINPKTLILVHRPSHFQSAISGDVFSGQAISGEVILVAIKLNADKSPFQRTYAIQVESASALSFKKSKDVEKWHESCGLRFFKEQMSKADIAISSKPNILVDVHLDDVEARLGELESELIEINTNNEKLQRSYNEFRENISPENTSPEIVRPENTSLEIADWKCDGR
ncbi:hypothetical protein LXL04_023954 [Taraxacum kok-saghyz]